MFEVTPVSSVLARVFGLDESTPCGVVADYLEELGWAAESVRQGGQFELRVLLAAGVMAGIPLDFQSVSGYFRVAKGTVIKEPGKWAVYLNSIHYYLGDYELMVWEGEGFLRGESELSDEILKVGELCSLVSGILGYPTNLQPWLKYILRSSHV